MLLLEFHDICNDYYNDFNLFYLNGIALGFITYTVSMVTLDKLRKSIRLYGDWSLSLYYILLSYVECFGIFFLSRLG